MWQWGTTRPKRVPEYMLCMLIRRSFQDTTPARALRSSAALSMQLTGVMDQQAEREYAAAAVLSVRAIASLAASTSRGSRLPHCSAPR